MGRDQRLRRMGLIRKTSQAPDPLDYWRERAKYFEQVVVAILVNTPGQQLDLRDANILGYELDAEALEDGGVRLKLRQQVLDPAQAAQTIGGPCVGGEEGPVCHGAEGPHVHPPGFTGHPIREPQEGDGLPVDGHGAHDCPESHSDACREHQCNLRGVKFYAD